MKEPIGRLGSPRPARERAHRVRDRQQRLVLADHALAQPVLDVEQLLDLALEHPGHRDAGPLGDDLGDVLRVDLLLEHALVALCMLGEARAPPSCSSFSSSGSVP